MTPKPRSVKVPYVPLDGKIRIESRVSYAGVESLLYRQDGLWIPGRKVDNNTYLERRDVGIALRLHKTDILLWTENDLVRLDTGGWYTMTTRDRANAWLPSTHVGRSVSIVSKRGYWMVRFADDEFADYHDGMVIDLKTRSEFSAPYDSAADREHNRQIDRSIERWLREAPSELKDPGLAFPSNSDYESQEEMDAELTAYVGRVLEKGDYPATLGFIAERDGISHLGWNSKTDSSLWRNGMRKFLRGRLYRGPHMRVRRVGQGISTAGVDEYSSGGYGQPRRRVVSGFAAGIRQTP